MYYQGNAYGINAMYSRIEKKDIRRYGNGIGLTMIILTALSLLLSIGLMSLIYAITGDANKSTELIGNDLIFSNVSNALFSVIIFILPFVFLMKILHTRDYVFSAFSKPKTGRLDTVLLCFFGFFVSVAAGVVTTIIGEFFSLVFGVTPYVPSLGTSYNDFGTAFVFDIICSCLFPALCEEFAMRGVVLHSLKKFGDFPAIVVSSLIFGLVHGNFQQLPYTFVMGLGLGYLTVRSGSIFPAMAVHFFNNLVATVQSWYPSLDTVLTISLTLLSVVATFILIRRGKLVSVKDVPSYFGKGKRVWLIVSCPSMIVFIIVELIMSARFFQ